VHAPVLTPQACLTRLTRARVHTQIFKDYAFTPHDALLRKCFSTSLSNLVDSLAVCSASDGLADLTLKWPDAHGRLLLQCVAHRARCSA
jgi:hypothetical protein